MNKRYVVRLTEEERKELQGLVSRGRAAARKITHARVLLQVDEGPEGPGATDREIAKVFGVNSNTVAGVRQRFVEEGLEAALNRKKPPLPPRSPILDGEGEARLIALRCGEPPEGRTRWTLHLLAEKLVALQVVERISYETVRRVLKKTS